MFHGREQRQHFGYFCREPQFLNGLGSWVFGLPPLSAKVKIRTRTSQETCCKPRGWGSDSFFVAQESLTGTQCPLVCPPSEKDNLVPIHTGRDATRDAKQTRTHKSCYNNSPVHTAGNKQRTKQQCTKQATCVRMGPGSVCSRRVARCFPVWMGPQCWLPV